MLCAIPPPGWIIMEIPKRKRKIVERLATGLRSASRQLGLNPFNVNTYDTGKIVFLEWLLPPISIGRMTWKNIILLYTDGDFYFRLKIPQYAAGRTVKHPHITYDTQCMEDNQHLLRKLLDAGDYAGLAQATILAASSLNKHSMLIRVPVLICEFCGSDTDKYCKKCDKDVCEDCGSYCSWHEGLVCHECTPADECENNRCSHHKAWHCDVCNTDHPGDFAQSECAICGNTTCRLFFCENRTECRSPARNVEERGRTYMCERCVRRADQNTLCIDCMDECAWCGDSYNYRSRRLERGVCTTCRVHYAVRWNTLITAQNQEEGGTQDGEEAQETSAPTIAWEEIPFTSAPSSTSL